MKFSITASAPGMMLCMLILVLIANQALAQQESPDLLVNERIQCIQSMLDKGKPAANTWWYGWLAGYSIATVAQSTVFVMDDTRKTRQDMVLGAGTTLLGAVGQLLTPMIPGQGSAPLSRMPGRTREESALKLKFGEELLRSYALREKEGRSWKVHAICGIVNISSGMITWLGFKRSIWAGIGNFALNTAISETQIWSQPSRAIKDYRHYCAQYNSGLLPITVKPEYRLLVNAYPGGITVSLQF
jgi:hypothetical protein